MAGRRLGFTLLEIVLGMAIFFGALAIFSQILWSGTQAAVQGQLRSQAMVRCEAKLGEVVAGAMPFQTQQNQAFSSEAIDQDWTWSVDVEPTNHPNLNAVVVTVSHTGNSPLSNAEVQLRRWMRDPAQMALVAQEAAKQEEENKEKAEQAKTSAETESQQNSESGSSDDSGIKGGGRGRRNGGKGGDKGGGNKGGGNDKGGGGGKGNGKGGGGKGGSGNGGGNNGGGNNGGGNNGGGNIPPPFPKGFPEDLKKYFPGGFPPPKGR